MVDVFEDGGFLKTIVDLQKTRPERVTTDRIGYYSRTDAKDDRIAIIIYSVYLETVET